MTRSTSHPYNYTVLSGNGSAAWVRATILD